MSTIMLNMYIIIYNQCFSKAHISCMVWIAIYIAKDGAKRKLFYGLCIEIPPL